MTLLDLPPDILRTIMQLLDDDVINLITSSKNARNKLDALYNPKPIDLMPFEPKIWDYLQITHDLNYDEKFKVHAFNIISNGRILVCFNPRDYGDNYRLVVFDTWQKKVTLDYHIEYRVDKFLVTNGNTIGITYGVNGSSYPEAHKIKLTIFNSEFKVIAKYKLDRIKTPICMVNDNQIAVVNQIQPHKIGIFHVPANELMQELNVNAPVQSLEMNLEQYGLAYSNDEKYVCDWKKREEYEAITSIGMISDNELLCSGTCHYLGIWNLSEGKFTPIQYPLRAGEIKSYVLKHGQFATSDKRNQKSYTWGNESGSYKILHEIEYNHEIECNAVSISKDVTCTVTNDRSGITIQNHNDRITFRFGRAFGLFHASGANLHLTFDEPGDKKYLYSLRLPVEKHKIGRCDDTCGRNTKHAIAKPR